MRPHGSHSPRTSRFTRRPIRVAEAATLRAPSSLHQAIPQRPSQLDTTPLAASANGISRMITNILGAAIRLTLLFVSYLLPNSRVRDLAHAKRITQACLLIA